MPVYVALLEDPYSKGVFRVTLFQDTEWEARGRLVSVYGKHVRIISLTERDERRTEPTTPDIPRE